MPGICQACASMCHRLSKPKAYTHMAYASHMPVTGGPPTPPDTGSEDRPNSIWHMTGICQIGIAFGFRRAEYQVCVLAYAWHMPITGGEGPDDEISGPSWSKCAYTQMAYAGHMPVMGGPPKPPDTGPKTVRIASGICLAYARWA